MAAETPPEPLAGLRVLDLSTWIAGAYCTKLLADGGAEVIKVELPGGDPLRRWSASGRPPGPGADGALFNHLGCSKRSIVLEPGDGESDKLLDDLLASADVVVWSPGRPGMDDPAIRTPAQLRESHPHLLVTSITAFGLDTPWSDKPATEFTLQALSGGIIRLARGCPDRAPTAVGGQVGEWMAGLEAAIGTLAALRGPEEGGSVDVSMLEALAATLTYYPVTFQDMLGRPIRVDRFVPTPGVSEAKDGMVGLGTGTGQQWFDFCAMVGRPEWTEEPSYLQDRTSLAPEIDAWVAEHTVAEVLDLASAFRLPNAPIVNGANAADVEHFRARDTFCTNPRDGALRPRPPWRFESVSLREPGAAPALGEGTSGASWSSDVQWTAGQPGRREPHGDLPFVGLRVLDMTTFWAGPLVGHVMALLGAEVLHLEAPNRPDGVRYVGGVPPEEDDYLERSPIFTALNTNKSGLAIDARSGAGAEVLRKVIATCDVLVENYTPRVLEQLGLDAETLREINPGLITVRMPGFGLDGPWRDNSAFAFVIEDASGLTWTSGHPDIAPIEPYSIGDPNAGLHALFGLQLALEHRDRTGEGGLVEAAGIEAALAIAAEQVVEYSATGHLMERTGNHGPMASPQNVYKVTGTDEYGQEDNWVAIAVATDSQWEALVGALGDPEWALDAAFATEDGRRAAEKLIDSELAAWCEQRSAADVVAALWGAGVPVAPVNLPHQQVELSPMEHRAFFEEVEHPVTGASRCSTLPMVFSAGPDRWHRRHAPLLGEHTAEVLESVGVTTGEIEALRAEGVIA